MKTTILTYPIKVTEIEDCTISQENGYPVITFNKKAVKPNEVATPKWLYAVAGVFLTVSAIVSAVGINRYHNAMEEIAKYEQQQLTVEERVLEQSPQIQVKALSYVPMVKKSAPVEVEKKERVYAVPTYVDTSFKAYMDYRKITDEDSVQYEMQENAWTGLDGVRRIGDDLCVAMGTYYSDKCGKRFKITLDTGKEFNVIISDIKDDKHTDETNRYTMHGEGDEARACVVEFIVDVDEIGEKAKNLGDLSCNNFEGEVVSVEEL